MEKLLEEGVSKIMLVKNILLESSSDTKTSSIYIKCNCGEEILEFLCFYDADIPYYFLRYHGILSSKAMRIGYNDFRFKDKYQVIDFCNNIERQIEEYNLTTTNPSRIMYDNDLPGEYIKKYGRGLLEIKFDADDVWLSKWIGEKGYNKEGKKKYKWCNWELILNKETVLPFIGIIKKIVDED